MNVILTGLTDGVVRMWSLDYVQVIQCRKTFPGISRFFNWFENVAQVPNEETPAQVPRTEEMAEAPKLAEESEEDSPDDAQLPGAILQRQASVSSWRQTPKANVIPPRPERRFG